MKRETISFTSRQAEVMDAALDIIADSGIKGLTMKAIGRRLKMTDAGLYRHFKSKADILFGITLLFEGSSREALQKILASKSIGLGAVRQFFLDRCREFTGRRGMSLVMFSEDLFKNDRKIMEKMQGIMSRHREMLMNAISQAQNRGEIMGDLPPAHVFIVVMGSLRLLVTQWHGDKFSFDLARQGEILWQTLERLLKEKT